MDRRMIEAVATLRSRHVARALVPNKRSPFLSVPCSQCLVWAGQKPTPDDFGVVQQRVLDMHRERSVDQIVSSSRAWVGRRGAACLPVCLPLCV